MINDSINSVEVMSADKRHILLGIFSAAMIIVFELGFIHDFPPSGLGQLETIFTYCCIHIPVLCCIAMIFRIVRMYKNKVKFPIFFARLEDVDIKHVRENYHVCLINENHIIFVDKPNKKLYSDWLLVHTFSDLKFS